MKSTIKTKPELLAPAGDLEKLYTAVLYGADAVYLAGEQLGLRAKAKNFSVEDMAAGIAFAHNNSVKVYAAVNVFAHNEDFIALEAYLQELSRLKVDALIISDPGIFSVARNVVPELEIHISTQANITNSYSALFWHGLGASRVVLARELSLMEIEDIHKQIPPTLELEAFVHGAMCISYSGRCLLSNYMANRDANHGECAQPCRWKYHLAEESRPGEYWPIEEDDRGAYIMNSKDLCMLAHIPELLQAGISSFKLEGRMKTPFYVATVTKAYRQAIDDYLENPETYRANLPYYLEEIKKTSHRFHTTGFYFHKPSGDEQVYSSSAYIRNWDFIGLVLKYDPQTSRALIEQRNKFLLGQQVEFLTQKGPGFRQTIENMYTEEGAPLSSAPHPQQKIWIPVLHPLAPYDMMRCETNKKISSPDSSLQ